MNSSNAAGTEKSTSSKILSKAATIIKDNAATEEAKGK